MLLPWGKHAWRVPGSETRVYAPETHVEAPPTAYDVIVVLGAAVWPDGQPSPALQRRVLHAVDLLQRGYAAYLLVTGGVGKYPPAEAAVMQRLAVAHGIPPQHILCEDQATSTFASALRCCDMLRQRGWSRVLVVTDRYHLPRALFAFWSCGLRAVGQCSPGQTGTASMAALVLLSQRRASAPVVPRAGGAGSAATQEIGRGASEHGVGITTGHGRWLALLHTCLGKSL